MLRTSTFPVPAMSNAVPWSTEVARRASSGAVPATPGEPTSAGGLTREFPSTAEPSASEPLEPEPWSPSPRRPGLTRR
nr:hypothetical protein [Actinosynnema mirum]